MEKILITGTGMLASALGSAAHEHGFAAQLVPRSEMDVTDADAVEQVICSSGAGWIFHTAAMTKVNQCEENPQLAHKVNATGTKHIVQAAEAISANLVYFSTDYVFDGAKDSGWVETDEPNPLNEYGRSKLAGEQYVSAYECGHIVRTSGVFGTRSDGVPERNFVKAIATKLESGDELIHVVDDQYTAITYSEHLAQMVLSLMNTLMPNLVHLTSAGTNSWFGWAKAVTGILGTGTNRLQPVPSKAMDTGTSRPTHCVLKSLCRETSDLEEKFQARRGLRDYLM